MGVGGKLDKRLPRPLAGKYAGLDKAKFISLGANLLEPKAPAYTPGYALFWFHQSENPL